MGMLFRIAYRNIKRHKRRTLTSALTIGIGLMFFIYMDSLFSGMDRGAIDNMIDLSVSSVKIRTKAYNEEKDTLPLKHGISNVDEVTSFLEKDKRVTGVAPRTVFMGELSNGEESIPVVGTAIDPIADIKVFTLAKHTQGKYLESNAPYQIVLGKKLAADIGVKLDDKGELIPGQYTTLWALTRNESQNADEFEIVGILETTDPNLNSSSVLISLATAEDFLDLEGLVTELNVALERRTNFADLEEDMREIQASVNAKFSDLSAETYAEIGAGFLAMTKGKRAGAYVLMAVVLLIAAVGIFNTILMSVYERIREIGVLRAHGMKPGEITWMFLLEGLLTGVAGGFVGLFLGSCIVVLLVFVGIPFDKMMGDEMASGIPIWGTVYGEFHPGGMIFAFAFGIVVALVAGFIPARRAGKLTVTQALRFV